MAGATVTGQARVALTGVNAAGMITGAMSNGTVSGLGVTFNLNTPIVAGFDANLLGPVSITQVGSSSGGFSAGTLNLATNTFNTNLNVNLNCSGGTPAVVNGGQCAAIASLGMLTFPIVQMAMISNNMAPFPVGITGLNGSAMLSATVQQMNAGQAVTLSFRGREVARSFVAAVPEPVEAGMLILGVLALCGVAALRRQTA
jgi:hypothetical protein